VLQQSSLFYDRVVNLTFSPPWAGSLIVYISSILDVTLMFLNGCL
jgi:hypothetical protein